MDQKTSISPDKGPSIAIVGGGFGGIACAVKLKQAGFHDVTVFEQSPGPGGTWWDNTYPGCEVDIPSHAYSFSFFQDFDWTRTHARRSELQAYADATIDRFGLRPKFRFGTKVESATWDEARRLYRVRLADGETRDFNIVVSALGMLNVPKYPDWPGLEDFQGIKFHTARWEHQHDLTGQRVAFVGTGSTASQAVPELAAKAGHLTLFQRSPAWVMAKADRDYTPEERARFRRQPWRVRWERLLWFIGYGNVLKALMAGSKTNKQMEAVCLAHLHSVVQDPELRRALTPDYPWGCKRPVFASTFYEALTRPNVTLAPKAVQRVTRTGVVDADGVEREIDVLIMSTGFQPQRYVANLEVVGRDGTSLEQVWNQEPAAFLGITVPRFPNFFMLYGPNTNGGSIIMQLESQAGVVVRAARRMRRHGLKVIDTRPSAYDAYVRWVDRQNHTAQSASFAGCGNYFFSPGGRNVTQWPGSQLRYRLMTRLLPRFAAIEEA